MVTAIRPVSACSREQLAELFAAGGWPAFIGADASAALALPRVRETFGPHELAVLDGDVVLAAGWGVPLGWSGDPDTLPGGYADALHRALRDHDDGRTADTFVLCAIQVRPDVKGRGVAAAMVTGLVDHARHAGLARVVAPLRPTAKRRYPLTPIADYVAWARDDGEPFDPWVRLHVRFGARVIGVAEDSQVFTGTVAEWQEWSGLILPASGRYIVPEALAPLTVDRSADLGTCGEPAIWVQHG